MPPITEKLVVRAATLAAVVASVVLGALMHTPARLPSTALGSELLLAFERTAVVLVVLLFLLVVVHRGWHARVPFSGRSPVSEQNEALLERMDAIQEQLDSLDRDLGTVTGA
jgi:hypothetical protein